MAKVLNPKSAKMYALHIVIKSQLNLIVISDIRKKNYAITCYVHKPNKKGKPNVTKQD